MPPHPRQPSDQQLLHTLLDANAPAPSGTPAHVNTLPRPGYEDDQVYLSIWEREQNSTQTRWTVATFFFSISFAIFGFSFQAQLPAPLPLIARVSGLFIYWFALMIFSRFNTYTRIVRSYLYELEQNSRTTLEVQTRVRSHHRSWSERLSSTRLLIVFGVIYAVGVGLLAWLVP